MKKILEVYGVHDLESAEYINTCKDIAQKIIYEYHKKYVGNYFLWVAQNDDLKKRYILNKNMKSLEYHLDRDWITSISIYIANGTKDAFVVDNTISYRINDSGLKVITRTNYSITKGKHNYIVCLERTKDKIIKGSIVIVMDKENMYSKDELSYIIMHELGHLYDLYSNKTTTAHMNRDLIHSNDYNSATVNYINKQGHIWTYSSTDYNVEKAMKINDMNFPFNEKLRIIKQQLNEEIIDIVFSKNIYRLNQSEMHQKITNFIYDLNQISSSALDCGEYEKKLRKLSPTYNAYYNTAVIFKLFIKYTPDSVKKKFAENI